MPEITLETQTRGVDGPGSDTRSREEGWAPQAGCGGEPLSPGGPPAAGPPPAAAGRAPTAAMTHRRPRGGAGCSAPRHVRAGLRMPPGPARVPAPALAPCPPRPPRASRRGVAGRRARGRHHGGAGSSTLTHSVLHHAPHRAFREAKWTPVEETAAWAPAPRAQPRARPALAHPGGCRRPGRPPLPAPPSRGPTRCRGPLQGDPDPGSRPGAGGGRALTAAAGGRTAGGRMRTSPPRDSGTRGRTTAARTEARRAGSGSCG